MVLECAVPVGRQPLRRPGVRCYTADLRDETTDLGGVPVTTPVRTAVDALRWLRPHMGLGVADALAAFGLVTRDGLVARVAATPGLRGIARARYLAHLVEARTESFGESWLRLRIADAGFPRPAAQVVLPWPDGRCRFRLDLGWEDELVAAEYDGEEHHASREQQSHDQWRRGVIEREYGWRVLAVGRGEVLGSSLRLERAIGELLGLEPRVVRRRW